MKALSKLFTTYIHKYKVTTYILILEFTQVTVVFGFGRGRNSELFNAPFIHIAVKKPQNRNFQK